MEKLVELCSLVDSIEDELLRQRIEDAILELLKAIGRDKIIELLNNNNK